MENYSKGLKHGMKFIPFSLRYTEPDLFSKIILKSMQNMGKYRLISIAGISPPVMDYTSIDPHTRKFKSTLFDKSFNLDGVIRLDPHRRTSDLGKWHVTVKKEK